MPENKLYKALVEKGLYTKGEDDFNKQFSTYDSRQRLYLAMAEKELYTKTFRDFDNQFFGGSTRKEEKTKLENEDLNQNIPESLKKKENGVSSSPFMQEDIASQPKVSSPNIPELTSTEELPKYSSPEQVDEFAKEKQQKDIDNVSALKPILEQGKYYGINTWADYTAKRGVTPDEIGVDNPNLKKQLTEADIDNLDNKIKIKSESDPMFISKRQNLINNQYTNAERYILGTIKSSNAGLASVANTLDNASKIIEDLSGGTLKRGGLFKDIENYIIDNGVKSMPDVPEGVVGSVLTGVAGLNSMFIEMGVAPEIKGLGILGSPFVTQQLLNAGINTYGESREGGKSIAGSVVESTKATAKAAPTAIALVALGYPAGLIGKAATEAGGKFLGATMKAGSMGLGFTGIGQITSKLETGKWNEEQMASEFAMGAIFSVPEFAKLAYGRAFNSWLSSSPESIKFVNVASVQKESLREKAVELRSNAESETNTEKKIENHIAADAADHIADIRAVTEIIISDPQKIKESVISDEQIPDEQKSSILEKIDQTVADNDPRNIKTSPLFDLIDRKNAELVSLESNKFEKPEIIDIKRRQIKEDIADLKGRIEKIHKQPLSDFKKPVQETETFTKPEQGTKNEQVISDVKNATDNGKKILSDFDDTLYDTSNNKLTPLGEEIKKNIANGKDVEILTHREDTPENRKQIVDLLGISPEKIKMGLEPKDKANEVSKVEGEKVFVDDKKDNLDAVSGTGAEVIDANMQGKEIEQHPAGEVEKSEPIITSIESKANSESETGLNEAVKEADELINETINRQQTDKSAETQDVKSKDDILGKSSEATTEEPKTEPISDGTKKRISFKSDDIRKIVNSEGVEILEGEKHTQDKVNNDATNILNEVNDIDGLINKNKEILKDQSATFSSAQIRANQIAITDITNKQIQIEAEIQKATEDGNNDLANKLQLEKAELDHMRQTLFSQLVLSGSDISSALRNFGSSSKSDGDLFSAPVLENEIRNIKKSTGKGDLTQEDVDYIKSIADVIGYQQGEINREVLLEKIKKLKESETFIKEKEKEIQNIAKEKPIRTVIKKERAEFLKQRIQDNLAKLSNVKFAVGEESETNNKLDAIARIVMDSVELGGIKIEDAIEGVIKQIPQAIDFINKNKDEILKRAKLVPENEIIDQIKENIKESNGVVNDKTQKLIDNLTKEKVKNGAKTFKEVSDAIENDLKDSGHNWDKEKLDNIISGYESYRNKPTKSELYVAIKDIKTEGKLIATINDFINGKITKKSFDKQVEKNPRILELLDTFKVEKSKVKESKRIDDLKESLRILKETGELPDKKTGDRPSTKKELSDAEKNILSEIEAEKSKVKESKRIDDLKESLRILKETGELPNRKTGDRPSTKKELSDAEKNILSEIEAEKSKVGGYYDIKKINEKINKNKKQEQEYRRRILDADYSTKKKTEIQFNQKLNDAVVAKEKAKLEYWLYKTQYERKKVGWMLKVGDFINMAQRTAVLSYASTIAKIGAVMVHSVVIKLPQFIGQNALMHGIEISGKGLEFIGKTLGIEGLRERGVGMQDFVNFNKIWGKISVKAMGKFYSSLILDIKYNFHEAYDKKNKNLEIDYGKRYINKEPYIMSIPGRTHGFMKGFIKNAEMKFAHQQIVDSYIRNGEEAKLADPLEIELINALAIEHGKYSILMNENFVVSKINTLRNQQNVFGTVFKSEVPIIKIPTNYVARALTIKYGVIKALVGTHKYFGAKETSPGLIEMFVRGSESLNPEQTDIISKNLALGSMGATMLIFGYLNRDKFKFDKKGKIISFCGVEDKDVGGFPVNKLAHSPFFESMFQGAMLGKEHDSRKNINTINFIKSFAEKDIEMMQNTPYINAIRYGTIGRLMTHKGKFKEDFFINLGKKKLEDIAIPGFVKEYFGMNKPKPKTTGGSSDPFESAKKQMKGSFDKPSKAFGKVRKF